MVEQLGKLDRVAALQKRHGGFHPEVVDVGLAAALDLVLRRPDQRRVEPELIQEVAEDIVVLALAVREIILKIWKIQ